MFRRKPGRRLQTRTRSIGINEVNRSSNYDFIDRPEGQYDVHVGRLVALLGRMAVEEPDAYLPQVLQ